MKTFKLTWLSLALVTLGSMVALPVTVWAGHGFYVVDQSARTGMLVSLTQNPGVVEPATDKNIESLLGVIGASATDLDVQPGQLAVQTDGVVPTLVSTLDGDIAVGDRIAPSSLVGLGSKREVTGWVVGTAQASLNATSPGAVKTTIKDSVGMPHEVYVAAIPVLVRVTYFNTTQQAGPQNSTIIPNSIQALADSVAGKRASVLAVILASLLILIGVTIAGYIINSTIRTGIQAIGRQPLAKQAIVRRMVQTLLLAAGLLLGVTLGAFILIRVF